MWIIYNQSHLLKHVNGNAYQILKERRGDLK